MNREDMILRVDCNYSVSTSLENKIVNRDGGTNTESIKVIEQPEVLTAVVLSTEPQNRDLEEVQYQSSEIPQQADSAEVEVDKELKSVSYSTKTPNFKTKVTNLEGENIKISMDELMGD